MQQRPFSHAYPHIRPMFDGPLDIVGDIHGEIDALRDLLRHLGYSPQGVHPDGRRLVFAGDLCDRGPDSPAVIAEVAALVERGLAQCVLGNHELNLLRGSRKEGNGWFFADNHDALKGHFVDSAPQPDATRAAVKAFLSCLPLALERSDIRVVHAAWHTPSIDVVRQSLLPVNEIYREFEAGIARELTQSGLGAAARRELDAYEPRLHAADATVPLLLAVAQAEEKAQMGNPIRIITSGIERATHKPYYASGKWRMVNRVAWWEAYRETPFLVFGHYWRWPTQATRAENSRGEPDLFVPAEPQDLLGPLRNAYCVDFAVGARYAERLRGAGNTFECRLAAVRWPEKEVAFDHGVRLTLR